MEATLWMPEGQSTAESLGPKLAEFVQSLNKEERIQLNYNWPFWMRPKQCPPPKDIVNNPFGWKYWFISAGRAFGKTRTASEYIRHLVTTNKIKHFALAGPTHNDVEAVMLENPRSGILNIFPNHQRPRYIANKRLVRFHNGAEARLYTGEKPGGIRGPEPEFLWLDEFANFQYAQEFFNLFIPALRTGIARCVITTTPKPIPTILDLVENDRCVITKGHSDENKVNVSEGVIEEVKKVYGDSQFAAQELGGEILGQAIGASFHQTWIDKHRTEDVPDGVRIVKIIIAVDPSSSNSDAACECGIVAVGLGSDGKGYFIEDYSGTYLPSEWINEAYSALNRHQGSHIIYEDNHGNGFILDLCRLLKKDLNKLKAVHATSAGNGQNAKTARAMPISAMVENGRIRFIGKHKKLEQQLTTWTAGEKSPDRMDAFVWGFRHLLLKEPSVQRGDKNIPQA